MKFDSYEEALLTRDELREKYGSNLDETARVKTVRHGKPRTVDGEWFEVVCFDAVKSKKDDS